jgi:2,4'-dihydroxyacetophenone dioxygenase
VIDKRPVDKWILDRPENGGFAAYEDGFSLLELCRKYYQQAGLDVRQLETLIR